MNRHAKKFPAMGDALIRLSDVTASAVSLAVLAPLFAAVAAAIKLEDGGSIFFRQERAGRRGIPFRILKFRSMVVGAAGIGAGLYIDGERDDRITRIGKVLRKLSIDELPQLVNILRGEMSLVGPRPGMPFQAAEYTERQRRRLDVRPGLTGWAQVNGRNSLSWPERIELDLWYIGRRSLLLNLRIILMTIPALLRSDGLYAERAKFLLAESVEHAPAREELVSR